MYMVPAIHIGCSDWVHADGFSLVEPCGLLWASWGSELEDGRLVSVVLVSQPLHKTSLSHLPQLLYFAVALQTNEDVTERMSHLSHGSKVVSWPKVITVLTLRFLKVGRS